MCACIYANTCLYINVYTYPIGSVSLMNTVHILNFIAALWFHESFRPSHLVINSYWISTVNFQLVKSI